MNTRELTTGEKAIPVVIRFFITKKRLISALGEILWRGYLTKDEQSKSKIIKEVRGLYVSQGYSTFDDWHEDTEHQAAINSSYDEAEKMVKKLFPELLNPL